MRATGIVHRALTGSDSWIRTNDLWLMRPTRTTAPLYRINMAGDTRFELVIPGSKPGALGQLGESPIIKMAGMTGLEPATPCVTGR